ncbi:MAG: hypothetical protein KAI16_01445 [Candidatus Pacebacteria bacterium]|nr:hypothetical protein [Candidatus Paceibacterota bacterium]
MSSSKIERGKFLKSECREKVILMGEVKGGIQKQIRMDYFLLPCNFLNSTLLNKTNDLLKRIDDAKKRGIETSGYIRKNLLRIRKEINLIQGGGDDKKGGRNRGVDDGWHY